MKVRAFILGILSFCLTIAVSLASSDKQIRISNDLKIIRVTENVWVHISFLKTQQWGTVQCNGLIYINNKQALVLDTPPDCNTTKQLIDFIRNQMKVDIQGVIIHHWHADCMGGLEEVHRQGIKSYASNLTCQIAESRHLPVPTVGFENSLALGIGNKAVVCKYFGPAHSADNIITWIPEEKILFAGCLVKDANSTTLGNISDANLIAWPVTLGKIKNKFAEAKIVVPGHSSLGDMYLIQHTLNLLRNSKSTHN